MSATASAGIVAVIIGVVQDLLATVLVAVAKRINFARFMPLRAYRARLLARMEEMPFLYKDMRLSARDDYVEPQLATVVDKLNQSYGNPDLDFRKPFMRFHESRRAIVFGEGGYGKTTLFRHLTIRCIQQTRKKPVLDGSRLVPVFVALKTTKASDYPILDAIQRSDEYFFGDLGLRRIARLAKSRRLLLFLDGYDEMPHAGGMAHVINELETIFGEFFSRKPSFFEAGEHGAVYQSLQKCRVYLSSRREFFFYSPFFVSHDVQKWVVKGLEDRRIELVEKIFANYRDVSTSSSGVDLDAELFMQELKFTADNELHQLSKSPLFLTVMCFVYVRGVSRNGKSTVFSRGAFDIINECILLLVSELDAAKAKGLTGAQRTALANRRSAFPDEKIEFLKYFSVRLYDESVGTFDREYLNGVAERFFGTMLDSPSSHEIIRGLKQPDPTVNVVEQIILSGIFVLVDRYQSIDYFDFPHRRFRETLAVSFFNNDAGAQTLTKHLLDASYGELILVYIEQSLHRGVLLRSMIEEVVSGRDRSAAASLFAAALAKLPDDSAQFYLAEILSKIDSSDIPVMPTALLEYVPNDSSYSRLALEKVRYSLETNNDRMLALWLEVVARNDVLGGQELLRSRACDLTASQLRVICFSTLKSLDPRNSVLAEELLRRWAEQDKHSDALADLLSNYYIGQKKSVQKQFRLFLSSLLGRLNEDCESHTLAVRAVVGQAIERLEISDSPKLDRLQPAPWSPWRN